uniref:MD-2-related lipid-recognition domain-containing protein n=1 Tax=Anopheles minimus TaxID=112268 RepID=A0A182WEZ3_9DIPT
MISAVLICLLKNIPIICTGASSYSITVKKYVCIDTPYKESTLYVCKNIPRRNAPTMIQVLIHVPKLYDIILVKVSLFYKFSTYQPFLITVNRDACESIRNPPQFGIEKHVYDIVQETVPELLAPCPSGNRTYNITWYLQDRHAPKNIPAGDYKLQVKLQALPDVPVFGMDVYCSVRSTGIVSKFMLQ